MKLILILLAALTSHATVRVIDADQIRSSNRASVWSFPNSSATLTGLTSTQTLTNKTIAGGSNTITGLNNGNLDGAAAITNANLSLMSNSTVKGNVSGFTGTPSDLTGGQVTAMLTTFTGDSGSGGAKGLVPAPSAGDTGLGKFLMANGGYSVPPIPVTPSSTGAVLTSYQGAWVASVVPVPPCVALAGTDVDWSLSNCFTKTLSANTTLTFSKRQPGQTIIIKTQNSIYTLTFPRTNSPGNSVLWSGSTIPTASTSGKRDIWTVFYDGTDMFGNVNQNF